MVWKCKDLRSYTSDCTVFEPSECLHNNYITTNYVIIASTKISYYLMTWLTFFPSAEGPSE